MEKTCEFDAVIIQNENRKISRFLESDSIKLYLCKN